jgi:5-formyltetrahydrofolate cyclo-ligase
VPTKSYLRKILRFIRQEFVVKRNSSEIEISGSTLSNFRNCLRKQDCVAAYLAVGGEVEPSSLLRIVRETGLTVALPCVDSHDANIIFRVWDNGEPLERSPLGFRQPCRDAKAMSPTLILTPLVGFDRSLNRLGQGAGHYDRAFADHPQALRIGLAWSVQEVPAIPTDPWDVPLDAVITEREWIVGPHSRQRED